MKFSLKHQIIFVTFAAALCGVGTYFCKQAINAQRMAFQARAMAEAERDRAMRKEKAINELSNSLTTLS